MNKKQKKQKKKAFYFTLDAFLASLLLIVGLLLVSKINVQKSNTENMEFLSQDIMDTLSRVTVYEVRDSNPYIKQWIADGNITNLNNTLLEQIGEFWAKNGTEYVAKANLLAGSVLNTTIPSTYGFNLSMSGDTLFYKPKSDLLRASINTRRMISGIEKGKPILGSSSDAFLKSIRDKPSSVFLYFGGFIGQGNVTGQLYVPPITNITEVIMELDVASPFSLMINEQSCQNSTGGTTFIPVTANMTSDYWDISRCNASLVQGFNKFLFIFPNINQAYVGGGYVKVSYRTDKFQEIPYSENSTKIYLPGIAGIVNLFDSFYVPGELHNLNMYLHYIANHTISNYTFYVTIGNKTVYLDNTSKFEMFVNLTDINFTNLNYSEFNSSTIPLRIGFENLSFEQIITGGEGSGDVVLITDVSGSMAWNFTSNGGGINIPDCDDPDLYLPSTSRLSLAKCLDKEFAANIIFNNSFNRIGLVSYTTLLDSYYNITRDYTSLAAEIDSYTDQDNTCIACGIAKSRTLFLNVSPLNVILDVWKYNNTLRLIAPPANWYEIAFSDSSWPAGNSPLGIGAVTTHLGTPDMTAGYVSFPEKSPDELTPDVEFTSGINSTGNTFGYAGASDGWDNASAVYGNISGCAALRVSFSLDPSPDSGGCGPVLDTDPALGILIYGQCNGGGQDLQYASGAYGTDITITPAQYALIAGGNRAVFSFDYAVVDHASSCGATEEDAFVLARFNGTYLGNDVYGNRTSSGTYPPDGINEVAFYPQNLFNYEDVSFKSASFDVTSLITGPGKYYIDFGIKVNSLSTNTEYIDGFFDNIALSFMDTSGSYYFRQEFNITNPSRVTNLTLLAGHDASIKVYINDQSVYNSSNGAGDHWDSNVSISPNVLRQGNNIVAVELNNSDGNNAYFDMQLQATLSNRSRGILIMSDGDANVCTANWEGSVQDSGCNNCGSSNRPCCPDMATGALTAACPNIAGVNSEQDQMINLSCYLHDKYGVDLYSVAFGYGVTAQGSLALNLSVACQNASHFYQSSNTTALRQIYLDIADSILTGFALRQSQVIITSGGSWDYSTLFSDSFIELNYTPFVEKPKTNEISLTMQSGKFQSCTPTVDIPLGIRVLDANIISFSGAHWTDFVAVNGIEIFNLSKYNNNTYITLGDPFVVQIPAALLHPGMTNNITLKTGDEPTLNTNCSNNNSLQYIALVNSSTGRTNILSGVEGCNWTIESEDFKNVTIQVPKEYKGARQCNYTNYSIGYDESNTYDVAVYNLLKDLDFDIDGRILVNLQQEDLEINVIKISGLPYQWGPSVMQARLWQ